MNYAYDRLLAKDDSGRKRNKKLVNDTLTSHLLNPDDPISNTYKL